MTARIENWGNDLALRLPRNAASELRLSDGSQVQIAVEGGALVIRLVANADAVSLGGLFDGITDSNRRDETSTGVAVGNER